MLREWTLRVSTPASSTVRPAPARRHEHDDSSLRGSGAAAGLEQFRLHDLRHFYASGLIADGCDVVTVQRALGHAKATTTLNTYAHLWPTAEDRTRRAAGNLLAEVLPILADRVRTSEGS